MGSYSKQNPARFCSLFYRSFNAVIFKKNYSKKEIEGHIAAAKKEIEGSKSKQKLIEAIEQLAEALETAQNARQDAIEYQELLKRCSDICNHVDQLMDENKDKTPAIHELYKRNRLQFRKNVKDLIEDVRKKAEEACREARGTPDAEAACKLYHESQKLDEAADSETNLAIIESMAFIVKSKVNKSREYHYLLPTIDKLDSELNFNRKLSIIRDILGVVEFGSSSQEINGKLDAIYETVKTSALDIEQILPSIKQMEISLKPGIKEEIQVTVGLSGLGSGAQHVITIPLQEIHYAELKEDIQKYADKILDIGKLPGRLKDRIMEYIRKNEDKLKGDQRPKYLF